MCPRGRTVQGTMRCDNGPTEEKAKHTSISTTILNVRNKNARSQRQKFGAGTKKTTCVGSLLPHSTDTRETHFRHLREGVVQGSIAAKLTSGRHVTILQCSGCTSPLILSELVQRIVRNVSQIFQQTTALIFEQTDIELASPFKTTQTENLNNLDSPTNHSPHLRANRH